MRVHRIAGRRDRRDDAGLTLTELLVSMMIFTIVVAVFFGGLVTMTRSTVRAGDVTEAGDSLRKAFQTMDKQVRYASSINFPGPGPSGAHYVEFLTESQPDGLAPLCTQWRLDPTNRVLQTRTWRDAPSSVRSSWATIATDVRNPDTNPPFRMVRAGGSYARQQLAVAIEVGRGEAGPAQVVGAEVTTVFVARNSSEESPSNFDLDANGQSDTPVCSNLLERP